MIDRLLSNWLIIHYYCCIADNGVKIEDIDKNSLMRKTTKDQVKGGKIVTWKKLSGVLEFFDVQKFKSCMPQFLTNTF